MQVGSVHTNNQSIEVQVMRKVYQGQMCDISMWPEQYKSEFISVLQKCHIMGGSVLETLRNNTDNAQIKQ